MDFAPNDLNRIVVGVVVVHLFDRSIHKHHISLQAKRAFGNKILFPLIIISITPFFLILVIGSLKSNHYIQSSMGQIFLTIVISMIFYLEVKQLFIEIDKKHNLLKIPRCHHSYVGIYLIFQFIASFLLVLNYIFNGLFA